MKLIQAATITLFGAPVTAWPNAAGLTEASRGLEQRGGSLRKHPKSEVNGRGLQLFDGLFGSDEDCGDKCTDATLCSSFETSSERERCNSGCVPKFVLDTCDRCDEAAAEAAVAKEKRFFGFGEEDELDEAACADCDFYRCCVEEGTGFAGCKAGSFLPDPGFNVDLPGIDSLAGSPQEESSEEFPGWDVVGEMWGEGDKGSEAQGAQDGPGISVLGRVVDSFSCPETCDDDSLCEKIFVALGLGETTGVEDACNSNCVPEVNSCEEACAAEGNNPAWLCDACEFFTCCGEDGKSFGSCSEKFPDMTSVVGGKDWVAHAAALEDHKEGLLGGLGGKLDGAQSAIANFTTPGLGSGIVGGLPQSVQDGAETDEAGAVAAPETDQTAAGGASGGGDEEDGAGSGVKEESLGAGAGAEQIPETGPMTGAEEEASASIGGDPNEDSGAELEAQQESSGSWSSAPPAFVIAGILSAAVLVL